MTTRHANRRLTYGQWLAGGVLCGVAVGLTILVIGHLLAGQADSPEAMVDAFWLMVTMTMPLSLAYVWASTQFAPIGSPWGAIVSAFFLLPMLQGGLIATILCGCVRLARHRAQDAV